MPPLPPWLRDLTQVDRAAFTPRRAVRCALGVVVPLAVGVAVHQVDGGLLAAVGALNVGVVSLTQGRRTPFFGMVATGLGVAASAMVGSLCGGTVALALVVLAAWGAFAGLLAGVGALAGVVGTQLVVGYVVLGRFPLDLRHAATAAAEVLIGAAVQILFCTLIRPPVRDPAARAALAELADALAASAAAGGSTGTRATAALLAARPLIDASNLRPGERPRRLQSMFDELERMRLQVTALSLRADAGADVLAAAGADLHQAARALRQGSVRTWTEPDAHLRAHLACHRGAERLAGQLRALAEQLGAWEDARGFATLRHPGGAGLPRPDTDRARTAVATFLHPTREIRRHALRLAVVLPAAELLARALSLERGYWVALTAVVTLRADFGATVRRGAARVVGTLVGVVPASLLVTGLHPRGYALVALVGVLAVVAYGVLAASFALFSSALAALVVVLLDVVDPRPFTAASARALDTLLGGALALLAFRAYPSWEGDRVELCIAALVDADNAYAQDLLRGGGDRSARAPLARAAREARASAEASLARARDEPARHRPAELAAAPRLLAATQRLAVALRSLDAVSPPASPALSALADALQASLQTVSASLREDAPPARGAGELREAAGSLPDDPLLGRAIDELVDSAGTLLDLVARSDA